MTYPNKSPDRGQPVPGAYIAAFNAFHCSPSDPINEAISRGIGTHRLPCPQCDKSPRDQALSVTVGAGGTAVWKCWRCNWTGSTRSRANDVVRPLPTKNRDTKREQTKDRNRLCKLWRESGPLDLAHHRLVRTYLEARGLGAVLNDPPTDIRFSPRLAYWARDVDNKPLKLGEWPALLAVVRGPDGRAVTLHRTYLALDGSGKADVPAARKLCSTGRRGALHGAAIRLYEAGDRLALAEGIETALAVRSAGWPAWSCISAGGLQNVTIPDTARQILLAADFDQAGVDAAEALARRLTAEGRHVRVAIPDAPGTDWADEIADMEATA